MIINDLGGGPEEIEKKFRGPSPGNALTGLDTTDGKSVH